MMAQIRCRFKRQLPRLSTSRLYNEQTFYRAFVQDLTCCRSEAIIESPFITTRRVKLLLPTLRKMVTRGVRVNYKYQDYLRAEAEESLALLQDIGVEVLFTGGHHRKLAIFDKAILWEGSLNILSQNDSCEIMRRIESSELADEMIRFTQLYRFLA